ncbi:MAG TPA: dTDP-glucose 4,6-dehydratase [Bacteroidetes bacterium]|nr:dTDP-glucose 4,6-dehydratase [Bacteroidota bacterium]HEX04934.1 dTDP-glucose 4,6-dehydratase [Bacteroidota bacterium]
MRVLITGGAGFIGSNLVHYLLRERPEWDLVNVDALTYAGNLENLSGIESNPRYVFVKADITDTVTMNSVFEEHRPDAVLHLAAESHVDRSILDSSPFIRTNVLGTQILLDATRAHSTDCRFVHVSTDEVYGTLGATGKFLETTPLAPNSPYSASKASSDMLVRAAHETFGMDVVTTRCSNNYGPYQFPEKLIPLMIANARDDKPLPVYGDGQQVRDWLYVTDHCSALLAVLEHGKSGEVYNIGGNNEWPNLEVVRLILEQLGKPESLIRYVQDRPGHDRRYAIDPTKLSSELGWTPSRTFERALPETIQWYIDNETWVERVRSGQYMDYFSDQYGERLSE